MGGAITCCKGCIPPKRHLACHDTCEEYKKEKAEWEEKKQKIKEEKDAHPKLTPLDFAEIHYVGSKRYKRKRRN